MAADPPIRLDALVESTHSLQRSIADLSDEQARADSLLPGWSRGHVLTHVARNADAMVNLATWARTGEVTPMYPSRSERDAVIQEQAGRPAGALVADIEASHEQMLAALEALTPEQWEAPIRYGAADTSGHGSDIPVMRRTEVEVHHVDLALDYTLAHWPEDFVESLLERTVADFSARESPPGCVLVGNDNEGRWTVGGGGQEISGTPPSLLGWLIGRTDGIGLYSDQPLPEVGVWK